MENTSSSEADRRLVDRLDGLYVGFLSDEEMVSFERCVEDGYAHRNYEGAGGFMGLAKVRRKWENTNA